jgi:hypothetical protein
MTGGLTANYGFEAGVANTRVLEIFKREETFGVKITGILEIGGNNLFIGGKQILSYESSTGTASVNSPYIDFQNSVLQSSGYTNWKCKKQALPTARSGLATVAAGTRW